MEVKHEVTRAVIEKKTICTSIYCDRCNERIYTTVRPGMKHFPDRKLVDYYDVATGHNDWGNDSIDSRENKTLCPECVKDEYIEFNNMTSGKFNTRYIVIEHQWTYDFGEWTNEEENSYD